MDTAAKTHYRAKRNRVTLVTFRLLNRLISFGMTCTKLRGSRQTYPVDVAYRWGSLEQGHGKGAGEMT